MSKADDIQSAIKRLERKENTALQARKAYIHVGNYKAGNEVSDYIETLRDRIRALGKIWWEQETIEMKTVDNP